MTEAQFATAQCSHCGGAHSKACPRVRSLSFSADGKTLVSVTFWARWDDSEVIYAEDTGPDVVEGEIVE